MVSRILAAIAVWFVLSLTVGYALQEASAAGRLKAVPTPGVVLIHGGGFVGGDPSSMEADANYFRSAGYRALTCRYTLGNIGAAITDVHNCVKTFKEQGRKVILWGVSAGGTLAEAVGLTGYGDLIVAAMAPTNFNNWVSPDPAGWYGSPSYWAYMGNPTTAQKAAWSPVNRIDYDSAPLLMLHSYNDTLVGLEQPNQLAQAIAAKGRPANFIMMDTGHVFNDAAKWQAVQWMVQKLPPSGV